MNLKKRRIFLLFLIVILCSATACADGETACNPSSQTESMRGSAATCTEAQRVQEETGPAQTTPAAAETVTEGATTYRGFVLDNVLHSETEGDIHYNLYVPDSYDGSIPYALFVTLPGYEGLYMHGAGANLRAEEYGFEAQNYNREMIVAAPQLHDWGETSADQAIALTEHMLSHYNINPAKVYLQGLSGGGETGSLIMGKRPELFAAFLAASTQWDGDLEVLAKARTPVYFAVGEDDSYYGSQPLKEAYAKLRDLYRKQGLSETQIDSLAVLDVKEQAYFSEREYSDQYAGGLAFAFDKEIMGWLFSK